MTLRSFFFCCRCLLPQAPKAGSWGSFLNPGNDTCIHITIGLWLALAHALQFRIGSAPPSPIHLVIPRSIGLYHNTPLFRCRAAASPTHRQIDTHKRGVALVSLEGHTGNQPGSERSKTEPVFRFLGAGDHSLVDFVCDVCPKWLASAENLPRGLAVAQGQCPLQLLSGTFF